MIEEISTKIRKYRIQQNITMEQLAEAADISVSFLSKFERQELTNISVEVLNRIATALGIEIADFFKHPSITSSHGLILVKYLETLTESKQEDISEALLKLIAAFE
ncbi:helix-turn-helix domain-containing protein [Latilactobacillus sakei]|uniref:helix-turn-helix domain-containing protein n=1 Tax=Latilactobacillus sakei TaxID=1599 RepID=UPI003F52A43F